MILHYQLEELLNEGFRSADNKRIPFRGVHPEYLALNIEATEIIMKERGDTYVPHLAYDKKTRAFLLEKELLTIPELSKTKSLRELITHIVNITKSRRVTI